MAESVSSIVKTDVGFFGATYKSKKFSLALVWAVSCYIISETLISSNPAMAIQAIYAGSIVVAAYVIGQSLVEAATVFGAKDTKTTS